MPRFKIIYVENGKKRNATASAADASAARDLALAKGLVVASVEQTSETAPSNPSASPGVPTWVKLSLGLCITAIVVLMGTVLYLVSQPPSSPPGPSGAASPPASTTVTTPAMALDDAKADDASSLPSSRAAAPNAPTTKTSASPSQKTRTFADIVQESGPAFAVIKTPSGSGSGFLIAPGLLATNSHVVSLALAGEIRVFFPAVDSSEHRVEAVVSDDQRADIALLRVAVKAKPLRMATADRFRPGEEVIIVGSPGVDKDLVLQNAVTRGVMSTLSDVEGVPYFQISASINPGNSGGPVLAQDGLVIAMATLKATKQEGIAFGVPANALTSALDASKGAAVDSVQSGHDARAVFRRMRVASRLYAFCMNSYVEVMDSSISAGKSASSGIEALRATIDESISKVNEAIQLQGVRSGLQSLQGASTVDAGVKAGLVSMWEIVDQLRSYAAEPRGSFVSYRDKYRELKDELDRVDQRMQILLGVDDKDK